MARSIVLVSALTLIACRREPDHAVSHPEPIKATGSGSAGSAAAPDPKTPPAGMDTLVPVPADIVAHVALREVVRGLERPVALVAAPGDPRKRLFIVEQHTGRIRILENGKLAAKPFLTVGGLSAGEEEGLLGLAFHPDYATTGKLYINYTGDNMNTHVVEYRVSSVPDVVDPATRRELYEIKQPYSNHNGGNVVFGPDGKLYTGMGDGGSAGDPKKNGQNPTALLAKILRFDVDTLPAKPPEIVHQGVRNPWRFSFDVASGGLYIGDVGQNLWEYVWVVPIDSPRRNFGWNVVEGSHCYNAATCEHAGFTSPAAEYSHEEGCSITGGFVYRGKALPALVGRYFYADYCTGLVRSFRWTPDPTSPTSAGWVREHWDWKASLDKAGDLSRISSFGVDHDGELYLVKLTGTIYQLAPK